MTNSRETPSSSNPNPQGEATVQAIVTGMVQGVGYRFFVLREARRLGLQGSVANLADGSVEVRARGERPDLEALIEALHIGPAHGRVENVKLRWGAPVPATGEFIIGF